MRKLKIKSIFFILLIIPGILFIGCNVVDNDNENNNNNNNGNNNGNWRQSKYKLYNITNGIADSISYEFEYNWISYINENNFELKYSYIMPPQNAQTEVHIIKNESTHIQIVSVMSDITQTFGANTMRSITESTITNDYDLVTGLGLRSTSVVNLTTIINDGEPTISTPTNSETNYFIELQDEIDGVSIYKHSTGTGIYTLYKVKNGITLEYSNYSADNILYGTWIYTYPENSIIRTKVPNFMLSSYSNGQYRTVEVILDSEVELILQVKTFNNENILISQYESHYEKIVL